MTIHVDIPEFSPDADGNLQVNFPRGGKRSHKIKVTDASGNPQAMTGWSLAYIWRDAVGNAVVTKTTASGITVGDGDGTDDLATVTVDAADTSAQTGKKYAWALWRTDSTNDDPLATGTLVLSQVAAQP